MVSGLAAGGWLDGWTGLFLATTFLANASGFFPTSGLLPRQGVGAVSLLLLPAVLWARYRAGTAGGRRAYVVLPTTLPWLNVFVCSLDSLSPCCSPWPPPGVSPGGRGSPRRHSRRGQTCHAGFA